MISIRFAFPTLTSGLLRALILAAILSLSTGCGGCGGKVPKTGGTQKPGEGCQRDAECENGLRCDDGACIYERCNSAPDPLAFCAEQLDVTLERAVCDSGTGDCSVARSSVGGVCESDDFCVFGSICEDGACVETCVSSASCRVAGEACLARTQGSSVKYCQPSPGCDALEDPTAYCSDVLGVHPTEVSCNEETGECEVYQRDPGSSCRFDEQCFGSVCEDMVCTTLCEEDADCSTNRVCETRLGDGDEKICQIESCIYAPDPDYFCFQKLGDETAYCDFEGLCQRDISLTGQVIMVLDGSIGAPCSEEVGGRSPGLDLTYAMVTDGFGDEVLGRGQVVAFEPGAGPQGNDFVEGAPFGSNTPPLTSIDPDTGCVFPEGEQGLPELRSLGCGGAIALEFFSEQGAPIILDEEKLMLIGEYGPVCDERFSFDDVSEVYLCRDPTEVRERQDMSSCDVLLDAEQFDGIIIAYLYAVNSGEEPIGF